MQTRPPSASSIGSRAAFAGMIAWTAAGCASPEPVLDIGEPAVDLAALAGPDGQVRQDGVVWTPDSGRAFVLVNRADATGRPVDGVVIAFDPAARTAQPIWRNDRNVWQVGASPDGRSLLILRDTGSDRALDRIPIEPPNDAAIETVARGSLHAFVVAPDNRTFALAGTDAGAAQVLLIDGNGGAARSLGEGSPVAFSPDGGALFVKVVSTSCGCPDTHFAVDLASGARVPVAITPGFNRLDEIVDWAGGRPRFVIASAFVDGMLTTFLVDLATGDRRPLPAPGAPVTPSDWRDTPLARRDAWNRTCLAWEHRFDDDDRCVAYQADLWRTDFRAGAQAIAARAPGQVSELGREPPSAVSPDGRQLIAIVGATLYLDPLP